MKKILITGANGFVGQNLIASLKKTYEVFGLDQNKVQNLDDLHGTICNISDFINVQKVLEDVRPDVVIHLAAIVHKNNADTSEKNYDFINYECSKFLFDKCKEYNIGKVIYASTIEVYGECNMVPITEDAPTNPMSYYAISKLKAEKYLQELFEGDEGCYTILRFCPLYGKGFTLNIDKRVFLKKDRISYFFKKGDYSFDFCSINNVIDFVNYICGNETASNIYNLCDEYSMDIKSIVDVYRNHKSIVNIHMPYHLCSLAIFMYEHTVGAISKKDVYLSKRNFDKLFQSTHYSNQKAKNLIGSFAWNIENTLYGDLS